MTVPRTLDHSAVQRASPFGPIEPKRKLFLRFEQIHPVVRIAHIQEGVLKIAERILYDHELVLILQGASVFTSAEQDFMTEAGTLLLIPPFTPHSFHTPTGVRCAHIAIHFDFSPESPPPLDNPAGREPYEIAWPGGVRLPSSHTIAPGHWIEQALREVVDWQANETDPLAAIEASCRVTRVAAQMLRWGARSEENGAAGSSARINHERMARVLAHIAANLAGTLALEELAHVADVSRSRFVTLFRDATGGSPQQYIQGKRIAEARRLLADPGLQIKQIAAMTGFEDRYYFSKVFRRVDGLTPTQFRTAVLYGHSAEPEEEALD